MRPGAESGRPRGGPFRTADSSDPRRPRYWPTICDCDARGPLCAAANLRLAVRSPVVAGEQLPTLRQAARLTMPGAGEHSDRALEWPGAAPRDQSALLRVTAARLGGAEREGAGAHSAKNGPDVRLTA